MKRTIIAHELGAVETTTTFQADLPDNEDEISITIAQEALHAWLKYTWLNHLFPTQEARNKEIEEYRGLNPGIGDPMEISEEYPAIWNQDGWVIAHSMAALGEENEVLCFQAAPIRGNDAFFMVL